MRLKSKTKHISTLGFLKRHSNQEEDEKCLEKLLYLTCFHSQCKRNSRWKEKSIKNTQKEWKGKKMSTNSLVDGNTRRRKKFGHFSKRQYCKNGTENIIKMRNSLGLPSSSSLMEENNNSNIKNKQAVSVMNGSKFETGDACIWKDGMRSESCS